MTTAQKEPLTLRALADGRLRNASPVERAPYWWDAAPHGETPGPSLPAKADVAIVGSGFTGLSAASAGAGGIRPKGEVRLNSRDHRTRVPKLVSSDSSISLVQPHLGQIGLCNEAPSGVIAHLGYEHSVELVDTVTPVQPDNSSG
jgi:hypothetical protein